MELELFTTFGDAWDEKFHQAVTFRPDPGVENKAIVLYPDETFQVLEGFGGAVTDSAGFVYSLMDELQKRQLLETYFSPERMNYQFVRVHMDSCDFSLEQYEAMSDPEDKALASFSMGRTEKIYPPVFERYPTVHWLSSGIDALPLVPPGIYEDQRQTGSGRRLKA